MEILTIIGGITVLTGVALLIGNAIGWIKISVEIDRWIK